MKFAINKAGFYSHYGTDGTIEFDDVFNETNQPFNHKYIKEEWILDKDKLIDQVKNDICKKLDNLGERYQLNETYKYAGNYQKRESEIRAELKANRELLGSLQTKTVEELQELLK